MVVHGVGRIATDIDLKYTETGKAVVNFNVATDRPYKVNGEKVSDFNRCVAWNKTAEFVATYLGKGRLVEVQGLLTNRSWNAEDGTKRYMTEVLVERIKGLDRAKESAEGPTSEADPFEE